MLTVCYEHKNFVITVLEGHLDKKFSYLLQFFSSGSRRMQFTPDLQLIYVFPQ